MQVVKEGTRTFDATAALAPYLRVVYDATSGLVVAGAEDQEVGSTSRRHLVTGVGGSNFADVVLANAQGTVKLTASGAVTKFDQVYGAASGKVSATPNSNPIGMALDTAGADGDLIEVLRLKEPVGGTDEVGGLSLFDDFLVDAPAAATALNYAYTKTETNGLGVISSDEANGVLKFSFDAVAEAATADLYLANAPFDIDSGPIFDCRLAIFDIGDDAALDINFGMASGTHATDADSIAESAFFHLDGTALDLLVESDDGTTEVAATDSTINLVDDQYDEFRIDITDKAAVKFFHRATGALTWVRILAATTFDISAYTGTLTPIVHVEKTSNDTTADVRLDYWRVRCGRA